MRHSVKAMAIIRLTFSNSKIMRRSLRSLGHQCKNHEQEGRIKAGRVQQCKL